MAIANPDWDKNEGAGEAGPFNGGYFTALIKSLILTAWGPSSAASLSR